MKRVKKGQAGYIKSEKVRRFIITLVMFALPIGLYSIGLAINGTNKSILTVVAILGVLPAAKFCVDFIMIMLQKSAPEELIRRTEETAPNLVRGYELTVTAYEGRMPLDALVICGNDIAAFTVNGDPKQLGFFEKHIEKSLHADGYHAVNIKIFREERAFFDRIKDLSSDPLKHRAGIRAQEDQTPEEAAAAHENGIFYTIKLISI